MLTYGFAKKILIKKNWRQKRDFCCFSMTLKTVIFVLVQIQTLIFCKNRGYFCVYWVSKFEVFSSKLWKLIVKAMFARLRKLQFFKAVESCTGGYGRFRCQRVKQLLGFFFYLVLTSSRKQMANSMFKTLQFIFLIRVVWGKHLIIKST